MADYNADRIYARAREIAQEKLKNRPGALGGRNAPMPSRFEIEAAMEQARSEVIADQTAGYPFENALRAAFHFHLSHNVSEHDAARALEKVGALFDRGIPLEEIIERLETPSRTALSQE